MADSCNNVTGECHCKSHTTGWNCERCETNYFNSLKPMDKVRCEACKCPGTPDTDSYFASGCKLFPNLGRTQCFCDEGYTGYACDECANGYYGRPKLGEKCKRCNCNNNIDPDSQRICDKENGTCFDCLYHTTGNNCELCKNGYYPNEKLLSGSTDAYPCLGILYYYFRIMQLTTSFFQLANVILLEHPEGTKAIVLMTTQDNADACQM